MVNYLLKWPNNVEEVLKYILGVFFFFPINIRNSVHPEISENKTLLRVNM